jgi:hypothetical protein
VATIDSSVVIIDGAMVTLGYLEYREGGGLRNVKRDQIEMGSGSAASETI